MHSEHPDTVWSTLTAKAAKGATQIVIKDNVDDQWQVGDEIAIATTSFIPSEAEKRKITAVEGHTITLDSALEFDHDFFEEEVRDLDKDPLDKI